MTDKSELTFNCRQFVNFTMENITPTCSSDNVFVSGNKGKSKIPKNKLSNGITASYISRPSVSPKMIHYLKKRNIKGIFSSKRTSNMKIKRLLDTPNSRFKSKKANKKEQGLESKSSIKDLKSKKYVVTPICLKRTAFKAKSKVIKSSEELELEKIAILQKQMARHLQENKINLGKLKMRPKPRIVLSHPNN